MIKRFCDRCGEKVEPTVIFVGKAKTPIEIEITVKHVYGHDEVIDLCSNCKEQFYKWLSDKKQFA